MCDSYIYDFLPLTLMHVCMMQAILEVGCIYNAAEILSPTDERTNKAILGVGYEGAF